MQQATITTVSTVTQLGENTPAPLSLCCPTKYTLYALYLSVRPQAVLRMK